MRSLAGLLANVVLAYAILILIPPTDTAQQYKEGMGHQKNY